MAPSVGAKCSRDVGARPPPEPARRTERAMSAGAMMPETMRVSASTSPAADANEGDDNRSHANDGRRGGQEEV